MTEIPEAASMELPTPNLPLLRKVLDHIDAHPEEWNQTDFARELGCGTAYCIAGHAVAMTRGVEHAPEYDYMNRGRYYKPIGASYLAWTSIASEALGITVSESALLFYSGNSRSDVQFASERIAARAGEVL